MEDQHSNFIQIPILTDLCDNKCCSISTIPPISCQSIKIHKIQVMSIGTQELFGEKTILPNFVNLTSTVLELV